VLLFQLPPYLQRALDRLNTIDGHAVANAQRLRELTGG
jgi:hypothetical protein